MYQVYDTKTNANLFVVATEEAALEAAYAGTRLHYFELDGEGWCANYSFPPECF